MANTTNFGWETPDDTDLVKDGAAAMRTLGNAIDASLVDLKGGTTGQVLSKNTNTDMDFTWVTTDDANAIQNAIVDAKGDLIAASAADTPARLAVGNNGETLVADSSATTGLRWQATPSASNPVINSAMQVWQRGTSFSIGANGAGQYTADRWYSRNTGAAVTISRQVTGDTTNLPNIQYCLRFSRDSGGTSTAPNYLSQSFESVNSIPFAGKTVTFSFYARKGANLSGSFKAELYYGTGTDQNIMSTYTGITAVNSTNIASSLTTTWQRFSLTGSVATTATELAINFDHTASGTAGAADYVEITGLQIDVGLVALPFRTQGATLAGELAACQRYYQKSFDTATAPTNGSNPNGQVYYTRQAGSGNVEPTAWIPLRVTMRTAPSVTLFNSYLASPTGQWSDGSTSSANARTINASDNGFTIDNTDVTYSVTNAAIHYTASAEL